MSPVQAIATFQLPFASLGSFTTAAPCATADLIVFFFEPLCSVTVTVPAAAALPRGVSILTLYFPPAFVVGVFVIDPATVLTAIRALRLLLTVATGAELLPEFGLAEFELLLLLLELELLLLLLGFELLPPEFELLLLPEFELDELDELELLLLPLFELELLLDVELPEPEPDCCCCCQVGQELMRDHSVHGAVSSRLP